MQLLSLSLGFFRRGHRERRWRFLGGARFTVGAIVRVLFMRRYDARIRFGPLGAEDAADAAFFLEERIQPASDGDQGGAFVSSTSAGVESEVDVQRQRRAQDG